jgi:hypothetical protein
LPSVSEFPLAQIFSYYKDFLFSDHTRIRDLTYFFDSWVFPHQAMLTPALSRMVVGPEAAGSLLVGTVVKSSVDSGGAGENDDEVSSIIFLPLQEYNSLEAVSRAIQPFPPSASLEEMTSKLSSPFLEIRELIVCTASRQGCWCSYRDGWSDHPYCWINSIGIP